MQRSSLVLSERGLAAYQRFMHLLADTVNPDDKITKYFLVRRPRGDKSVWLESAGYSLEEPEQLAADLRAQLLSLDAQPAGTDSRVFEP